VSGISTKAVLAILALGNIGFFSFSTGIGPIARAVGFAPWHVGALVAVSGICIMLTSRYWGKLADRYGYRIVVQRGLIAYTAMFLCMSVFVVLGLSQSISALVLFFALLITRGITGISLGAIQVGSQVFVGVTSAPAQRAAAMAGLGAAAGIGMVAGPAIAALVAGQHLAAPVIAGVALGLLGLCLIRWAPTIEGAASATPSNVQWNDSRLRWPMLVAFCSLFCVIGVQINTSFYVMDRFGISVGAATQATGIALSAVGIALISAQIVSKVAGTRAGKPLSPRSMIVGGAGLASVAFLASTFSQNVLQLAVSYFVSGFGMGFVFPGFNGLASSRVSAEEQGVALGSVGAAQAFGMVLGPIAATSLYHIDSRLPYWTSACILAAVCIKGWRDMRAVTLQVPIA
jgi:MFS transporter, DHA1 family, tetracycline resistance protein